MLEKLINLFRKMLSAAQKKEKSKDAAKERLHLVLIQDRASVSADFLESMKQEIIEVIKKYIVIDENAIDVRLTNQTNEDGTSGAPALYANIPIGEIKLANPNLKEEEQEVKKEENKKQEEPEKQEAKAEAGEVVEEINEEQPAEEPIKEEVVVNVNNN